MNPGRLVCRVLSGYDELAALRRPWQALCDQCPWATPFLRPDWLLPWARHLGPDEPWLIAVHDSDTDSLIGLALMFRYQREGEHVLAFLGAGITDYLDILARPGRERAVIAAILAQLCARRARWDVCELDEVLPASPLLHAPLPPGWRMRAAQQSVCPILSLPGRVSELGARVPGRHLRRFRQYQRRAERAGELSLERATPGTRDALLDALFALHQARWRQRDEPGVLEQDAVRAFHRQVAAEFGRRDALALYGLRLDGRVIACLYGFEDKGTLYFYLSGFDPALSHLSPGVLLLGMVVEDAIRRGLARLDFLRGSEPYKRWWGAVDRHTLRLVLNRSTRPRRAGYPATARSTSPPASKRR